MYRGAGGRRQVSGGAGQGADRGTTGDVQHRAAHIYGHENILQFGG